jgi:hypothetical protein
MPFFLLQTSLPTVYWVSDRPTAMFDEVFNVDLRDKVRSKMEWLACAV